MKLKNCPCCGWNYVLFDGKSEKGVFLHYVRCAHCGFSGEKSRFKARAGMLWNRQNPGKVAHLYGREF